MSSGLPRTLEQYRHAIRAHELSAQEFLDETLQVINRTDPQVKAFLHLRLDAARSDARAADPLAPLAGAPIAVKDNIMMAGERCTCGSRILEDYIAPYSATVVRSLLAAGAVVPGKTNLDEFAMGSSTENSAFFATHNPADLSRVPGGSSGGSTAAVAAGFALGAIGSDTGGSVRQPAAFCGVVGFKPTYGLVSRYGLVAFGSSLDCIGPITRTVRDAAMMMNVMAEHDPRDATSIHRPQVDFEAALHPTLAGKRVGIIRELQGLDVQPEIARALDAAREAAVRSGASIVDVSVPHILSALSAYYIIAPAECSANLGRFDGVRYGLHEDGRDMTETYSRTRNAGFGAEVKRRILIGAFVLSAGYYDAYYKKAADVRQLITDELDTALQSADVLLTPTTPTTAFKIGAVTDPLEMYKADVFTIPADLAGIPAVSFPAGRDAAGLPVGLQLMGARANDADVLSCANVLFAALGGES
ncbi:MAG TPA: Asp-tRNA(Asn)/Glu-tRNA(Gln) amidotransferase subunit GatA [Clostridia bacterium]|nr:Asp-tRNA(Asn)/Glu-tRNA(Gln) amidotransferase subunit GatA [Clostridia bacterium]